MSTVSARHDRASLAVVTLAMMLVPLACARVRPAVAPQAWDRHGDSGPLRVYRAPEDAPGPRIYHALASRPELRSALRQHGEPDTLEVLGGRWQPKRIVLEYRRQSAGKPRRIYLEPTNDGFVASAPQPFSPTRRAVRSDRSRAVVAADDPTESESGDAVAPAPSAAQQLECPIDRQRPDCRAYCTVGATHEWCR